MKFKAKRIANGATRISKQKALASFPVVYLLGVCFAVYTVLGRVNGAVFRVLLLIVAAVVATAGVLLILLAIGTPVKARGIQKKLAECGIADNKGNSPLLLSFRKEGKGLYIELYSKHIPLSELLKRKDSIETVLNMKITSITQGKDMQHTIIKAAHASNDKDKILYWNDALLSKQDFEIVLGESEFGVESIDISGTPHILIGGGSGSGKSKLLKLILIECIMKGAKVFIADFKGGIDYPQIWRRKCCLIVSQPELEEQLSSIIEEMDERRNLLLQTGTANVQEYNDKTGKQLPRMIIACDEVAEVLDKTGLNKEEKDAVGKIESKLATIARMGRAFGIHLILATQRPDAEIIKGQIKNNLGHRICGRADKVLSQIILDNTDCANMIPPDSRGLFYTNDRVLFKAYYAEDSCLQ